MPTRIKELRKSHNMNQSELGKIVHVSASAIGMYEQGRRDPDTLTLLNIARVFNVSMDYLIGASDLPDIFDIDTIAKNVAKNLMDQPALMFNAECYTDDELSELSLLIENSVRTAISDRLQKN